MTDVLNRANTGNINKMTKLAPLPWGKVGMGVKKHISSSGTMFKNRFS
jgi:hypothetical protein